MINHIKDDAHLNILKLNMLNLINLDIPVDIHVDIPVDIPVEEDIDDSIKNLTLII